MDQHFIHSSHYGGVLREARNDVAPLIPHLAPQLRRYPEVIKDALCQAVQDHGLNPELILEDNYCKTERHTIAAFLIGQMRQHVVEGNGHQAELRHLRRMPLTQLWRVRATPTVRFSLRTRATMDAAARHVKRQFTKGRSPEARWYPLAEARYYRLGQISVGTTPLASLYLSADQPPIFCNTLPEKETLYLQNALQGRGLGNSIGPYCNFINSIASIPSHERLKAAHDLAYILTGRASMHFVEFLQRVRKKLEPPTYTVTQRNGRYIASLLNPDPRPKPHLPNVTLKCPAQTPGEDGVLHLAAFTHAFINAANDHGIFNP